MDVIKIIISNVFIQVLAYERYGGLGGGPHKRCIGIWLFKLSILLPTCGDFFVNMKVYSNKIVKMLIPAQFQELTKNIFYTFRMLIYPRR